MAVLPTCERPNTGVEPAWSGMAFEILHVLLSGPGVFLTNGVNWV